MNITHWRSSSPQKWSPLTFHFRNTNYYGQVNWDHFGLNCSFKFLHNTYMSSKCSQSTHACWTHITGSFLISFWVGLHVIRRTVKNIPPFNCKRDYELSTRTNITVLNCFVFVCNPCTHTHKNTQMLYQYDDANWSCKAPHEFIIHGNPTEIWVSVSLRIQPHRQACKAHTHVIHMPTRKPFLFVCLCAHTCNDSRNSPANSIVESHGTIVDVSYFCLHAVNMQSLHEQPCKSRHEEIMEEDGNHRAQELHQKKQLLRI